MKKILVSLNDNVWKIIQKELMPKFGDGDSEVTRQIIMTYLTEKGYLATGKAAIKDIASLEIMIGSLAQVLAEKGVIEFNEWEQRVAEQIS